MANNGRIALTPDVLRAKAGNIRTYKAEQDQIVKSLRSLVNGLEDSWRGKSQKEFTSSFNSMKKTFDNFSELLDNYARALENYANKLDSADKR